MKLFIASCLALLLSSTALAQTKTDVRYKRKTLVDFSDVSITGEIQHPELVLIQSRNRAKFRSLVRSRADFVPEMLEPLEQI